MPQIIGYTAGPEDEGLTLEKIMRIRLGLSPHQIRSAKFREMGVCLNGKRSRINAHIFPGDRIEVAAEPDTVSPLVQRYLDRQEKADRGKRAWDGVLIIAEDEDLLVVSKPAPMAIHPSHGHFGDTLCDWAAAHFAEQGAGTKVRLAGRLDKDTSGLVVFAKNAVAAARLCAPGGYRKTYLAYCRGRLPVGEEETAITLPIKKAEEELNRMSIGADGRCAATFFRTLAAYTDASKISVRLESGRTHQIRVHLSAIGHPLLGDPIYGGGKDEGLTIGRTALHCSELRLVHPFTGEIKRYMAPLPEDLCRLEQWLSQSMSQVQDTAGE